MNPHPAPAILLLSAALAMAGCASQQPQPTPQPPLASKPTVGQEVAAVVQNKVEVTFPNGGTELTPEANNQLDVAVRLFRDVGPAAMFSMGYADPTGDEYANLVLSARRAEAVKKALVARGIPPDRIRLQAFGSSDLANSSNPTDPENRRVVVQWRII